MKFHAAVGAGEINFMLGIASAQSKTAPAAHDLTQRIKNRHRFWTEARRAFILAAEYIAFFYSQSALLRFPFYSGYFKGPILRYPFLHSKKLSLPSLPPVPHASDGNARALARIGGLDKGE